MSAFLEGIGAVLGKVCSYIPGKIEKLKNERERLVKERDDIKGITMDIHNAFHRKLSARLDIINKRIGAIDGVLKNRATD